MKIRIAKELRRFAETLDNPNKRRARAMGIPLGAYSLFRRVESIAPVEGILDIGANDARFARWCATYFGSTPLHCFEPLPICMEALNKFASDKKHVIIHPFALGEAEGTIEMHQNDYSPSSSILPMKQRHRDLWPHTKRDKPIQIQVRRLDSFDDLFKPPIFLKIDVQGYELHVLRGGDNVLQKASAIQLEVLFEPLYEGQHDFRSVMNFLADRGFIFSEFTGERRLGLEQNLVYADALFVAERYRKKAEA